jgi:hypothetical protein
MGEIYRHRTVTLKSLGFSESAIRPRSVSDELARRAPHHDHAADDRTLHPCCQHLDVGMNYAHRLLSCSVDEVGLTRTMAWCVLGYAHAALHGLISIGLWLNEEAEAAMAVGRKGEAPIVKPASAPVIRSAWMA